MYFIAMRKDNSTVCELYNMVQCSLYISLLQFSQHFMRHETGLTPILWLMYVCRDKMAELDGSMS